jgi:hypothetical protein
MVQPAAYAALWGRWAGKEKEFYIACAELVSQLSWPDVTRICGPRVAMLARLTQSIQADLAKTEPEPALRCGSFRLVTLQNDVARLSSYADYDPVDVPVRLMQVLQYFQGQPTAEAVATIAEREKVTLDNELVRKLTDFELLVPAKGKSGESSPAMPSSSNPHSERTKQRRKN